MRLRPASVLFAAAATAALAIPVTVALVVERPEHESRILALPERPLTIAPCTSPPYCSPLSVYPRPGITPASEERCGHPPHTKAERAALLLRTTHIRRNVGFSRDWFASARDAALFGRLTAVDPADVGIPSLGTKDAVITIRTRHGKAAIVRVAAACPGRTGRTSPLGEVTLQIHPTAADAVRAVEAHVFRDEIRPTFGDETRCANTGSPRTCVLAVGRVSATIWTRGDAYDLTDATAAFLRPILLAETEATPGKDPQAAARNQRESLRLYQRLRDLPPSSVPLPPIYAVERIDPWSRGSNPLRVTIDVTGTTGEQADVLVYFEDDESAAIEHYFYGRRDSGVVQPKCYVQREKAECRGRVGPAVVLGTVSAYGNPPVSHAAYDEARVLALAGMELVRALRSEG